MNFRDGTILFLDKHLFESNYVHKIFREMFYGSDSYMAESFTRYRELFFSAFEWDGEVKYKMVDTYDQLVNVQDSISTIDSSCNTNKRGIQDL